jgi:hypothetical protein
MTRTFKTLFVVLSLWLESAHAGDLPPGTVINSSNIDTMLQESFDGHVIADVMPESMQFMVRN